MGVAKPAVITSPLSLHVVKALTYQGSKDSTIMHHAMQHVVEWLRITVTDSV